MMRQQFKIGGARTRGGAIPFWRVPRAGTLRHPDTALGFRKSRKAVLVLLFGIGVLALLFHAEAAAAVAVWRDSTAYNHCFLVLPIAAWLAWDRRGRIVGVPVQPTAWAALLALPVAAVWLAAERLGIMEGRQLAAVGFLELLFLAVLGWRLCGRLAPPLLYLFFLVPFGDFVTPWLQHFTWHFAATGLDLLGVPNFATGETIEIPEGTFWIAQACAGLRFLIASIAFGVLYACAMYRSPWRRLLFIAASILVPVIANGFRALGIIWLGHELGSAQAAATDHVLYGWLFFSIVTIVLAAAGAPFRQAQGRPDRAAQSPSPAPFDALHVLAAAAVLLVVAGIGPAIAAGLNGAATAAPRSVSPGILADFGCTPAAGPPGMRAGSRNFACDTGRLILRVEVFPVRVTLRPVLVAESRLGAAFAGEESRRTQITIPGVVPQTWHLVEDRKGAAATALWIGKAASGGLRTRLHQAWTSLRGDDYAPVVVGIIGRTPDAAALIGSFLQTHPELSARMAKLSAS